MGIRTVGQLLSSAFSMAYMQQSSLHKLWTDISFKIGGRLPNSLVAMSVQRIGELDLVLRCMENEFNSSEEKPNDSQLLTFHLQKSLSELWVGSIYEVVRLVQDRKIISSDALAVLYNDLTLLRVPLMKHEIARERKMKEPLVLQKLPLNNGEPDLYIYSHVDRDRGHIMPCGVSVHGSTTWLVIDIKTQEEYWLERVALSDRFIEVWST